MICVYTPGSTDFSGNGLGPVAPMSCTVTETLNGEWELTLEHPLDETGKWHRLVEGCILRAPVPAAMTPGITMVTQATPEVKREIDGLISCMRGRRLSRILLRVYSSSRLVLSVT